MTGSGTAASQYDRSRVSGPRHLPTPPPAVRGRNDAIRDHERLSFAFRGLLAASPPSTHRQAGAPSTPCHEFDAFDEAIAAANALSDTLREWRSAAAAASGPGAP